MNTALGEDWALFKYQRDGLKSAIVCYKIRTNRKACGVINSTCSTTVPFKVVLSLRIQYRQLFQ